MRLKIGAKRLLRKMFEQSQRIGVDLLPRHFYSEIPDILKLRSTTHWRAPYSMTGISGVPIESQLKFVRDCCQPGFVERMKATPIHAEACTLNGTGGFGPIESDFLYALVASRRPRQIFQIGCGVSTAVCLLAAKHAAYRPEIICVEPYPTAFLEREAGCGSISLLKEMAQVLDLSVVDGLGADVLFFVDSTHALGPAGEVSRIVLEMLPRLKNGHVCTSTTSLSRTTTAAVFWTRRCSFSMRVHCCTLSSLSITGSVCWQRFPCCTTLYPTSWPNVFRTTIRPETMRD